MIWRPSPAYFYTARYLIWCLPIWWTTTLLMLLPKLPYLSLSDGGRDRRWRVWGGGGDGCLGPWSYIQFTRAIWPLRYTYPAAKLFLFAWILVFGAPLLSSPHSSLSLLGGCSQTPPTLTSTTFKGQNGDQSSSNICFCRFMVQNNGQNNTWDIKLAPGILKTSKKALSSICACAPECLRMWPFVSSYCLSYLMPPAWCPSRGGWRWRAGRLI